MGDCSRAVSYVSSLVSQPAAPMSAYVARAVAHPRDRPLYEPEVQGRRYSWAPVADTSVNELRRAQPLT